MSPIRTMRPILPSFRPGSGAGINPGSTPPVTCALVNTCVRLKLGKYLLCAMLLMMLMMPWPALDDSHRAWRSDRTQTATAPAPVAWSNAAADAYASIPSHPLAGHWHPHHNTTNSNKIELSFTIPNPYNNGQNPQNQNPENHDDDDDGHRAEHNWDYQPRPPRGDGGPKGQNKLEDTVIPAGGPGDRPGWVPKGRRVPTAAAETRTGDRPLVSPHVQQLGLDVS